MGKLIGIARTAEQLGPMEEIGRASISVEAGIDGDARGRKLNRQVTILFRDGWEDACRALDRTLPWTTRRANLFVEGVTRLQDAGGRITIGDVVLEVTRETDPCQLMERSQSGLKDALTPAWRGGVCCRVVQGGEIAVGDAVNIAG
jgi:MOSC domain-containing protein YiiM